ncbi:inhibitor of host transcription [Vibrio phage D485]
MTKLNAQTATNAQIAEFYGMTLDLSGMPYALDAKSRRHYITDLRSKFRKEAAKKTSRKVATATRKIELPSAEEHLAMLNTDFTEHQWFIRESQPGLDISELGLRFYFIGGANIHQLNIRTKHFSNKELENFYANKKILKGHKGTGSVTIGSLSYEEVVQIAQDMIEKSESVI